MDIAIIVLLVIVIALQIFLLVKSKANNALSSKDLENIKKAVESANNGLIDRVDDKLKSQATLLEQTNKGLFNQLDTRFSALEKNLENSNKTLESTKDLMNNQLLTIVKSNGEYFEKLLKDNNLANEKIKEQLNSSIKEFTKDVHESLNVINATLEKQLKEIRDDNTSKLDKINEAVNEKLEKTIEGKLKQSFDNVIEQIGGVNKAIGEIKGLANDVGSLKTVLTNVKTKGIVGEVILGNIIKEILTVSQYEENVITKEKSNDRVEFAIKMPGENDQFIYLPIDSKLPLESYHRIKDAMDRGNVSEITEGRKELRQAIRKYAKDINQKYIDVPNTTDFAIMFLPIEGLYIEALNMGLFEEIQRDYKVNIAGPTTLTAILNALQMGFKTLVIQKKSSEVFKLLGAVKTEFSKFAETLAKTQKKFGEANDELDKLVGTRTRMIQSKLKDIELVDEIETKSILEIEG